MALGSSSVAETRGGVSALSLGVSPPVVLALLPPLARLLAPRPVHHVAQEGVVGGHGGVVHGVRLGHHALGLLLRVTTAASHWLEAPWDAVRRQVLGLHHVPRVDVLAQLSAEPALLHVEEVDHGEDDEHHGADQAVHPEDHGGACNDYY